MIRKWHKIDKLIINKIVEKKVEIPWEDLPIEGILQAKWAERAENDPREEIRKAGIVPKGQVGEAKTVMDHKTDKALCSIVACC